MAIADNKALLSEIMSLFEDHVTAKASKVLEKQILDVLDGYQIATMIRDDSGDADNSLEVMTMYEELIKNLRIHSVSCTGYPHYCDSCTEDERGCDVSLAGQSADAIEVLGGKVDSLQIFADNISKLPDCNTCMKKYTCEFMPKVGEYCRINCPAWLGEPEPPKEET